MIFIDIWRSKGDVYKAEMFYKLSISMISHRITPKYRLFLLYIVYRAKRYEYSGTKQAILSVKKEGTKILRMKIEIQRYLDRMSHHGLI